MHILLLRALLYPHFKLIVSKATLTYSSSALFRLGQHLDAVIDLDAKYILTILIINVIYGYSFIFSLTYDTVLNGISKP